VIDALDAVNLMTVHASKGLEFPIVFVVNLARGTGNWRDPIRISASEGEPSVSIGDFQSDADEDSAPKDREETKRLVYVALTRARDRLYLGSVLKDGVFQPGRGSLGEVVPSSLTALFAAAQAHVNGVTEVPPDGPSVSWGAHRLRVCTDESAAAATQEGTAIATTEVCSPLVDSSPAPARPVVSSIDVSGAIEGSGASSDRLIGLLVHRLMQRHGFALAVKPDVASGINPDVASGFSRKIVSDLLRPEERVEIECDVDAIAARVMSAYQAACGRDDVREILDEGTAFREVPFTIQLEEGRLRGAIDCLVRSRSKDGRITVLEFKTGRARPEHREQLEIYRKAANSLFPTAVVDARLIYVERR
jgi:ATP-dependent helicase/nuclease subunit A